MRQMSRPVKRSTMCVAVAILTVWALYAAPTAALGEVGRDFPIPAQGDQDWLNSLFYLPTEPRVRREYRLLSDTDRQIFNDAIKQLKDDTSVHPNKFTLLTSIHGRRSSRNSAHKGPGFLGWHRVFVLLLENALREKVPGITIPYWDTTLDGELEAPSESALFTEDFMGNGDEYIKIGIFKDWTSQNGNLYRTVGLVKDPMYDGNITKLLTKRYLSQISFPNGDAKDFTEFELLHNYVHNWVGGEMDVIETAADDPIFMIYHSFVDYVYKMFRDNQRRYGIDPVTDYVEYYGQARHHMYSPMGLGNLLAIDGFSDVFERNIVYEEQPACSRLDTDCKSDHLWCKVTNGKCVPWTIDEYNDMKSDAKVLETTLTVQANIYKTNKLKGLQDAREQHDHSHQHDEGEYEDERLHDSGDEFGYDVVSILMIVLYVSVGCLAAFAITVKCAAIKQSDDTNVPTGIVNLSYTENPNTGFSEYNHDNYTAENTQHGGQTVIVEHGYARVHIDRKEEGLNNRHATEDKSLKVAGMCTASPTSISAKCNSSGKASNGRSGVVEICPIDKPRHMEEHGDVHVLANHRAEEGVQSTGIDKLVNDKSNGHGNTGNNVDRNPPPYNNKQNSKKSVIPSIPEESENETAVLECIPSETGLGKEQETSDKASYMTNNFKTVDNVDKQQHDNENMDIKKNDTNAKHNMTSNNAAMTGAATGNPDNKDGLETDMSFGKQFYKKFTNL